MKRRYRITPPDARCSFCVEVEGGESFVVKHLMHILKMPRSVALRCRVEQVSWPKLAIANLTVGRNG